MECLASTLGIAARRLNTTSTHKGRECEQARKEKSTKISYLKLNQRNSKTSKHMGQTHLSNRAFDTFVIAKGANKDSLYTSCNIEHSDILQIYLCFCCYELKLLSLILFTYTVLQKSTNITNSCHTTIKCKYDSNLREEMSLIRHYCHQQRSSSYKVCACKGLPVQKHHNGH